MENNEDNLEQNPLKSASFTDSDENLIINEAFVADNNSSEDVDNHVADSSQLITDTDVCGCTSHLVNLQCKNTSAQNPNHNNPPPSDRVNTLNEGQEKGKSNWVYVHDPPDLHFPAIDMNVDIEGSKSVTTTTTESAGAAAAGSMNIVAAQTGKVNSTSSGGGGDGVGPPEPRNRTSPPNCQNRMSGEVHYSSSGTIITQQPQQASSSSYAAEFDPLSMNSKTVNNSHTNGASGISYARGYGAESMFRGINRYNDPGASSGGNGGTIQNIAVSAASSSSSVIGDLTSAGGSERAAYEFLDREMQYMLKFADPDQNLASMDELIQSGVDLLDLLPPEEGGVKPRFSNPSNDWKYDIIARYVDECNPVSECTCHLYDDGRRHDIHLCSVHHDTVSQDSDTLTMDTEGSLVNIPTIKLHATYVDGKSDHQNNNNSRVTVSDDSNSDATTTTTTTHSQQNYTQSDVVDTSVHRQEAMRTKANNAGGNSVVGYGASSSSDGRRDLQGQSPRNEESFSDKSADRSLIDTANNAHQDYGVDGTSTSGTDNSSRSGHRSVSNQHKGSVVMDSVAMDAQLSEGHQGQGDQQSGDTTGINSTVFAEVHVDATMMKYDEPTTTAVGEAGDRNRKKMALQSCHSYALETNPRPHDPIRKTLSDEIGRCVREFPDKQVLSHPSTASPPSHQQSRQQPSSNDTGQSTATTTTSTSNVTPAAAKINPDPSSSSPVKSSSPSSGAEASTSAKQKENYEKFLSRPPTTTAQDHRKRAFKKRPSLPIEPHTTQYQKHALLQERSDTGVLEFELLLAERFEEEYAHAPRRESLGSRKCSLDSSRMKLMPRTNQYEPHPLLRKTNSGMSEIEEVLQEKEQEFLRRMKEKRDSMEANSQPDSKRFMLHRGSLGRLEPRLGQYEKHSLLQSKNEDGRTALEMFLEEEMIERKASMTDHDTANFRDKEKLAPKKSNASDSSSNKGSIKKSRSKSSSLKKVHFERSGSKDKKKKPEDPESGISSKGEVSFTSDPKQDSAAQNETQGQAQGQGQEVDNGYDTDDDDKTEEDRLTGERAKAKLNKDQGKCCTIL